ncbi:alpha-E domain-containing protein [Flavobacteriaceae bacterium]|nr:alpha-E domain-containing protein [Flavobacteriaceae bacterium]
MLSRVANNLFWLERYFVRSHSLLNLIKANYLSNLDIDDISPWDKTVLNFTGKTLNELSLKENAPVDIIQLLLFDRRYSNSAINLVGQTRQNTRSVQEHVSKEIWQNVNKYYHFIEQKDLSLRFIDQDPITIIDEMLMYNMLHYSNADINQERGNAYCFMNLGKYIERLCQSIDFILLRSSNSNAVFDALEEHIYWKNLLVSVGGYQQFVKAYKSVFNSKNIIEFIVLNPFFPNSIYYCLNKIAVHSNRLNKFNDINPINDMSFRVDKLDSNLRYMKIDNLLHDGLESFLENLKSEMSSLNKEIDMVYFNNI